MAAESLHDLVAFLAVARERSFTRAAAKLGVSQSALSQTIRGLEERLGLRLLTRTTRSVAPTEAGERLLADRRAAVRRDRRRTGRAERAAREAGRHDPHHRRRARGRVDPLAGAGEVPAGLSGHQGRDHHRLRPDRHRRRALRRRRAPRRAGGQGHDRRAHRAGHAHGGRRRALLFRQTAAAADAAGPTAHACINLRLPTHGGLYAWEFEKDGRELKVRVEGQLVFNTIAPAQRGPGRVRSGLSARGPGAAASRRRALVRVLADWCPPFPGYHLYYPSRRQPTPAFALLVDALRYRG